MKRCEYCAKEISYHEMFCCEECEEKNNRFYELRDGFSRPFSIVNGIFVLMIGISILGYSFLPEFGVWVGAGSLAILGILYLFLPFPPDVMIRKIKLKKSILFCRIVSLVLLLLAAGVATLHLTGVI